MRSTATTWRRSVRLLRTLPDGSGKPVAIVAHTVKGKGVSFMEDDNNWHYRIPNADEAGQCAARAGARRSHEKRIRGRVTRLAGEDDRSSCCRATSATGCSTASRSAFRERFYNCGVAEQT